MDVMDMIAQTRDTVTARRAFGDPYEQDGVTIVPVAQVSGGGGGGSGKLEGENPRDGSGGGFGLGVVPAGVFVLKGGQVSWRPAVNVNKVILGAQTVAVVALLTLRSIFKARAEAERPRKR
jgi:uncharacterized spore protein YtfJ